MKASFASPRLMSFALAALLTGAAWAQPAPTEGEVRKVDKAAGKITLQHGEIKNLDMPPMTMVFNVRDARQLDRLKAGDKVQFRAEKDGAQYFATDIEPRR